MQQRRCTKFLVLGLLALYPVAVDATTSQVDACPANFRCSKRVAELLARGMSVSTSFQRLIGELAAHPGVDLDFELRRQKPGKHAQSFLSLSGTYVREGGETRRQVTAISGRVVIPIASYGHRQIELLAHELEHVRILLQAEIPHGSAEEEMAAIDFETQVRVEMGGR